MRSGGRKLLAAGIAGTVATFAALYGCGDPTENGGVQPYLIVQFVDQGTDGGSVGSVVNIQASLGSDADDAAISRGRIGITLYPADGGTFQNSLIDHPESVGCLPLPSSDPFGVLQVIVSGAQYVQVELDEEPPSTSPGSESGPADAGPSDADGGPTSSNIDASATGSADAMPREAGDADAGAEAAAPSPGTSNDASPPPGTSLACSGATVLIQRILQFPSSGGGGTSTPPDGGSDVASLGSGDAAGDGSIDASANATTGGDAAAPDASTGQDAAQDGTADSGSADAEDGG